MKRMLNVAHIVWPCIWAFRRGESETGKLVQHLCTMKCSECLQYRGDVLTSSGSLPIVVSSLSSSLPPLNEDYSMSKSSATVTHQSLPAFSQPFGGRTFRDYSPPYSSQQANTMDVSSWSYASASEALPSQYATGPTSRRQSSVAPNAPAQQQLSAAASLSASELYLALLSSRSSLPFGPSSSSSSCSTRPMEIIFRPRSVVTSIEFNNSRMKLGPK